MNFDLQIKFLPRLQLPPTLIFRLFLFSFPPPATSNYTPTFLSSHSSPFLSPIISPIFPTYFIPICSSFSSPVSSKYIILASKRCFIDRRRKRSFSIERFFFVRFFKLIFTTTKRERGGRDREGKRE